MLEFVSPGELDPLTYDRSYFLEPDGKSPKSYVLLAKTLAETELVAIKPAELKMAGQVVKSMVEDFDPDRHRDTYEDQLREPVQAKLEGGEAFS